MNIFHTILIQPLVNILFTIYAFLPWHDFGVSIIILTIIIRLILWPLAGKQLHSQKKMQAIQPEIAKIRAQSKGDKQKESQMLMELYKEKEVNPFSACLPAIIQFPVLIAMYFAFREATNVAQLQTILYSWVKHLPYIQQILSDPNLFKPYLFGVISMAKPSILLAILAGVSQFIQVKMITPKQTGPKDAQTQMNSMMVYAFPALTIFIAWNLPAALPLYWIVTNLVAILQQWLIMRKEVEVMEEQPLVKVRAKQITAPKKKTSSKKKKK